MNMKIYELLKSGKSVEEVIDLVNQDIDAAQAKMEEERKEAEAAKLKEEQLEVARVNAVTALKDYLAIANPDLPESYIESIVKVAANVKVASEYIIGTGDWSTKAAVAKAGKSTLFDNLIKDTLLNW